MDKIIWGKMFHRRKVVHVNVQLNDEPDRQTYPGAHLGKYEIGGASFKVSFDPQNLNYSQDIRRDVMEKLTEKAQRRVDIKIWRNEATKNATGTERVVPILLAAVIAILVLVLAGQVLVLQWMEGTLVEGVPTALLMSTAVAGATAMGMIVYRSRPRSAPFEPEARWQFRHMGPVIAILVGNCFQLWFGEWFAQLVANWWADWAIAKAFIMVLLASVSILATITVAFVHGVRAMWWWTFLEEIQRKRPALRTFGDRISRRRIATLADLRPGMTSSP